MNYLRMMLACAALVSTAIAGAQNKPPQSSQTLPAPKTLFAAVSEADLVRLVRAEGHMVDAMHPFDAPSVRGKTKDGVLFVLIGTACEKGGVRGCQGIMMQVRYTADSKVTADKINQANVSEAALSSWWDREDKTVGFTRYVVLDDGVTWMNLRQNLRVLLSIEDNAQSIVFK